VNVNLYSGRQRRMKKKKPWKGREKETLGKPLNVNGDTYAGRKGLQQKNPLYEGKGMGKENTKIS